MRRRLSASRAFAVLLLSHLVNHALKVASPDRWWTWRFVLVTDWLQALIVILIALEIGFRVFRHLPPGLRTLSILFRIVFAGLLVWLLLAAPGVLREEGVAQLKALRGLIGRVFYGSAILFAAFLGLMSYYRLPLDPVHRDVAAGLGVFGILVALADMHVGNQDVFIFALHGVFAFWVWSAWKPEEPTELSPEAMRFLQPWRAKRLGL